MRMMFVLVLLLAGAPLAAHGGTQGEIGIGDYLPDAKLHGFDGRPRKFSDYCGKPLIINVWASWCGPCREEMGSLQRLARSYGGKQFNVIGISTDDDGRAARAYIKRAGITFENFLDRNVFLEHMLGADTIPLTVLVDARGRILEKAHGAYEWDSPEVLAAIEETFGVRLKR
jgi:thiol-disulfide isomerase/thioredoxin